MKIAIMQPTYIPWAGYFALINHVDQFVFLDNVQFNERSWQQRNRIFSNGEVKWLSIPVIKKDYRNKKILDIKVDLSQNFYVKHLKTILQSYSKAENFDEQKNIIENFYEKKFDNLADMNISIIKIICEHLKIPANFLRASDIIYDGIRSDLLLKICKKLNCNEYISPEGSSIYLEKDLKIFSENNIKVNYFKYKTIEYKTFYKTFIPNLSIVDLMLNCGQKSKKIILEGILNN